VRRRRGAAFGAALVVVVVGGVVGGGRSLARAVGPTVTPSATRATVGDTLAVHLDGWSPGPVTVGVCGNGGLRGSQDCQLTGDQAIAVRGAGTTTVDLTLLAPPVPCPCVIRATTPSSNVVVLAPIELAGVPEGPLVYPTTPVRYDFLRVDSRVIDANQGTLAGLSSAVGGPTKKVLVIELRNVGPTPMTRLRIVGELGRHAASGTPIPTATLRVLEAGATRKVRIPFTVGVPAWGAYTVSGSVYGDDIAESFKAQTSNDASAVVLVVPIALLVYAQVLRRREGRATRRRAAAALPSSIREIQLAGVVGSGEGAVNGLAASTGSNGRAPIDHGAVMNGDHGRHPASAGDRAS
jgi:hypothetical protein